MSWSATRSTMTPNQHDLAAAALARNLTRESWAMYGVGMFIIFLRLFARIHRFGARNLQIDDYLMIVAACWYTTLIICLQIIVHGGGSNLYEPEEYSTFTPEDIQERMKGSKVAMLSEQAMLHVIYCIKGCILIMYSRLALHTRQQHLVKFLHVYIGIGYVVTQLTFFLACRPFNGNWAMPPPTDQCATLEQFSIVQGVFNISSDVVLIFVPLPLLWTLNIQWKQKLTLGIIFSMGIFIIIAALLTKIFNLTNIYDSTYILWYARESSVAVYVGNLPMIWPLMRQYLPFLRNLTPVGNRSYGKRSPKKGVSITEMTTSKRCAPVEGVRTLVTVGGRDEEDVTGIEFTSLGTLHRRGSDDFAKSSSDCINETEILATGRGIHIGTTVEVTEEHIELPSDFVSGPQGYTHEKYLEDVHRQMQEFGWDSEESKE